VLCSSERSLPSFSEVGKWVSTRFRKFRGTTRPCKIDALCFFRTRGNCAITITHHTSRSAPTIVLSKVQPAQPRNGPTEPSLIRSVRTAREISFPDCTSFAQLNPTRYWKNFQPPLHLNLQKPLLFPFSRSSFLSPDADFRFPLMYLFH